MATLTYAYASSTVVLGPLALQAEPGSYDLCALHAQRTTAPQGWEIIRLPLTGDAPTDSIADDDLVALAAAVREIGFSEPEEAAHPATETARVPHLRLVPPIPG